MVQNQRSSTGSVGPLLCLCLSLLFLLFLCLYMKPNLDNVAQHVFRCKAIYAKLGVPRTPKVTNTDQTPHIDCYVCTAEEMSLRTVMSVLLRPFSAAPGRRAIFTDGIIKRSSAKQWRTSSRRGVKQPPKAAGRENKRKPQTPDGTVAGTRTTTKKTT